MSDDRTPVDGPFRIGVDAIPTGVGLDVSHYLTAVILGIAQAADEDGEQLLDDLRDIAALARSAAVQGSDSHAAHERDEEVARLLAEVADDGVIPVYGDQAARLRDRLAVLTAPRPVPGQRGAA
ncbi:hypothetical protein [Streptomyces sp. NPDC052114]|uniref:hypothetical protein n=1 Tax=unclassified Streptomyces TaxID=2593676 RepID=UPI00343DA0E0